MKDVTYWLQCIHEWFPNLHNETYFLPPVHFNRVPYSVQNVAQVPVLVPQMAAESSSSPESSSSQSSSSKSSSQSSFSQSSSECSSPKPLLAGGSSLPTPPKVLDHHMRDDKAQRLVLNGLHALAEKLREVMVVVSQLWFVNYLKKPSYAAAAAHFPRPVAMDKQHRQGDFDVLIIHSQCGLITGEIKSVGENMARINVTQQESDDILAQKVQLALQQLNKSEEVLRFLVSDLPECVLVTKVLMLPFITRWQLVCAMNRHPEVGQAMCSCLGSKTTDEATRLCLCIDQLSSTAECYDLPNSELCEWWQRLMSFSRHLENSTMSSDSYEQLVARFCGPATTVDVFCIRPPRLEMRTLGEAVAEVGNRMTRLCLFPDQVNILNNENPRVFVSGPPGTGKTVMLLLKGVQWLLAGHDVHVVSTRYESRAVSHMLEHQLTYTMTTMTSATGWSVYRHDFDFVKNEGDVDAAVSQLETASRDGELYVIADEVRFRFEKFCSRLVTQVPGVNLWAASVYNDMKPDCMFEEKVTVALRSPPIVVEDVKLGMDENINVYCYSTSGVPAPTDGPAIIRLYHSNMPGHTESFEIENCQQCGRDIAGVLRQLHVGETSQCVSTSNLHVQYRDVLVLCHNPRDNQVNSNGQITSPGIGLVQGLHECHVPLHVVGRGASDADIRDMALSVRDEVTVASELKVQGLEWKVVVMKKWDLSIHTSSRCTSQLVLIDMET